MTTEAVFSVITQAQTTLKNGWKQGAARSNEHMVMIAQIEHTTRLDPIFCDVLGAIIEVAAQAIEPEPEPVNP